MGIYRNFSSLGKYLNLIFYRILFDLSIQIASLLFYQECTDNLGVIQFYYYMLYFYSLLVICLSVYHSKEFSKIIQQQKDFIVCFPTDDIYQQNLSSRKKIVYFIILVYNLYSVFSYTVYYFQLAVDDIFGCSVFIYYSLELTFFLSELRFFVEMPIISVLYLVLLDQVDAISRSLKTEIDEVIRFKAELRFDETFYSRFAKGIIFDNWSAAFAVVEKKSKLYEKVFGFQVCT